MSHVTRKNESRGYQRLVRDRRAHYSASSPLPCLTPAYPFLNVAALIPAAVIPTCQMSKTQRANTTTHCLNTPVPHTQCLSTTSHTLPQHSNTSHTIPQHTNTPHTTRGRRTLRRRTCTKAPTHAHAKARTHTWPRERLDDEISPRTIYRV